MLPGTCVIDVEETRKGEEVGTICHSMLPEQLPFASFAWPVASSVWATGTTVWFAPLSV